MIRGGRDASCFPPIPAAFQPLTRGRAPKRGLLGCGRMDLRSRYGPWALITGASAGLGECFARELGRQGFHLMLVARRTERLERLAADLRRECRVEAKVVTADLCEEVGLQAVFAAAAAQPPSLLVNNAGFGWSGAFAEQEDERIRRMVRLNCEAPARIARAVLPEMIRARRGAMLVIASVAGHMPTPWISLYGATKAFDLHLGEGLAVELRGSGVDVLSLSPGHTRTEFHGTAGIHHSATGGSAKPEDVVRDALQALGRKDVRVHGALNRVLCWLPRVTTRRAMAGAAGTLLARRLRRTYREAKA